MIVAFGDVEIDPGKGEIRRGGVSVRAAPRVAALLHLLALNNERLVTKDEIVESIWDGRAISDSAIATSVKEARQLVGDDGNRQAVIRTIHGQGFRCVAQVRILGPGTMLPPVPEQPPVDGAANFSGRPSIAVLPFADLATPGEPSPTGDGLAAELISALSRLRFVSVTARGSSFRFRQAAPDFEAVAGALGVRYCLSGLIEIGASEISVTVELARLSDGIVIWSDRYSGNVDRIHGIRREIVAAVIAALEIHIPESEAGAALLLDPRRLDAWGEYHLGLRHLYRFNPRDNAVAKSRFESAISKEPGFARAHAGLSFVAFQNGFMRFDGDGRRHAEDAAAHAERSLEFDLLDPFGNYCMGRSKWMTGEIDAANSWLSRSLEISPNFAQGHYLRSLMLTLRGSGEDARPSGALAMTLSPLDPLLYAMLGSQAMANITRGRFDEAALWAERAQQAPGSHYLLGMVAAAAQQLNDNPARARHWVKHTGARRPDADVGRFFEAFPFRPGPARETMEKALRDAGFAA